MEFWYYIVEDGNEKRVTHEIYEKYEGKKYYTLPYPGLRFVDMLITNCRVKAEQREKEFAEWNII